jgi:hypothetical protein
VSSSPGPIGGFAIRIEGGLACQLENSPVSLPVTAGSPRFFSSAALQLPARRKKLGPDRILYQDAIFPEERQVCKSSCDVDDVKPNTSLR